MTMEQEKVQGMLKQKLKEKGLKVTKRKTGCFTTFGKVSRIPSGCGRAFELMQRCRKMDLRRYTGTLQLLYEMQLIDSIHLNDGCVRYEMGHVFELRHSHHHLICKVCGRVIRVLRMICWRSWRLTLRQRPDFWGPDHELKVYGRCRECAETSMRKENA